MCLGGGCIVSSKQAERIKAERIKAKKIKAKKIKAEKEKIPITLTEKEMAIISALDEEDP